MRLWQNDLTPFLDDEAVLLSAAARMLDNKRLALEAGLALSIHVNEPPLVLYLDAIPMLISRNPAWVSACLTALDSLASVLIYKATERLSGRFAGFGAALLFAVAPAAIYYSRRIYYSELVPLCTAIFVLAMVYVWQRRSAGGLAVALVAAACATELHASAAPLLAVWIAVAILNWRWIGKAWRPLALGLGLVCLTLAPYVYLQVTSGWPDVLGVLRFLREPRMLDASALDAALTIIGGGIYHQLLLPYPEPAPPFRLDPTGWLLVAVVLTGAVLAAIRHRPMDLTLLAMLVLPVLASLRHTVGVLPYYLLPSLPPAAMLAGMACSRIPWRPVGFVLLAVPALWQVGGYLNLQRVAAADGPKLNYGMPLRYESQAADMAMRIVPAGSRLSVSELGNQATTFPYLTGYRYRLVESDSRYGVALAPDLPSAYLAQGGGPVYDFLAQHFSSAGLVRTSSGEPAFGLFRAGPEEVKQALNGLQPLDASIGGAIRLRGYAAPALAAAQPSPFLLAWDIVNAEAAPPGEVQQFAHLVDAAGRTWSTDADERAYPRAHWGNGDLVVTWFDLRPKPDTPTGGYWIETGFYGYGGTQPLPVGGGGTSVRIGPLRVAGAQAAGQSPPLAVFGDGELALLGARRQGSEVDLTWRADAQPSKDYTVFVHLLDAGGGIVAQNDSLPQAGAFPTTLWRAGDVIGDVHHLAGDLSAGVRLEIGLYTTPDLRRLPVQGGGDAYVSA
jgi:hypothetical protein